MIVLRIKESKEIKPEEKEIFKCPGSDQELAEMLERDIVQDHLNIRWEDNLNLAETQRLLEEAVVWPICMPDFFEEIRRSWRGVLMVGPSGTGKTLLSRLLPRRVKSW